MLFYFVALKPEGLYNITYIYNKALRSYIVVCIYVSSSCSNSCTKWENLYEGTHVWGATSAKKSGFFFKNLIFFQRSYVFLIKFFFKNQVFI